MFAIGFIAGFIPLRSRNGALAIVVGLLIRGLITFFLRKTPRDYPIGRLSFSLL
jgi:hypothetical protein